MKATERVTLVCAGLAACILIVPQHAAFAQASSEIVAQGEVTSFRDGLIYIGAMPHRIVSLRTPDGIVDVAVPSIGATPLQRGEKLSFSGRRISFGGGWLVDTRNGYVYRQSDKDMAQLMADMQAQAQAQAASAAAAGEPNAVPITVVESQQQRQERESQRLEEVQKRRVDLLIAVTALLVAVIALEKVPRMVAVGVSLISKATRKAREMLRARSRRPN